MSFAQMEARLKASVWQAIAQSGVDTAGLPEGDMAKLVEAITDNVLKEVDDILGEASGRPASMAAPADDSAEADDEERVLWAGRPFLSLSVYYQVTNERIRISEGLLGKTREDIELVRVQDVDHKQSLTERMLNLGDIYIRSHDASEPEVVLNNVSNPAEVHEILRRAILKARQKYNLSYREEM